MTSFPLLAAAPWWRPGDGRVLRIRGGRPLVGTYPISGAKNAALPLMVAALLTPHLVTLRNVPGNLDVAVLAALLQRLGCEMHWSPRADGLVVTISADRVRPTDIDRELVSRMRASVLLLGALLARCGEARLPLPGGDAIGLRGIDFHIAGLCAMGATVTLDGGMIDATARNGLHGADILLPTPSVGATENLMLAAVLASGRTTIRNAACEPEVADLAELLNAMGGRISGAGEPTIVIDGVDELGPAEHTIIPDRIEGGTYLMGAALTRGDVTLEDARPADLAPLLDKLAEIGAKVEVSGNDIRVSAEGELRASSLNTEPHPGFPTDLQAQYMTLMTSATGESTIRETIFENRFQHAPELARMGADIRVDGNSATVHGATPLTGAGVMATDLRASACLVLAGVAAEGETVVDRIYHLERGYEGMELKLQSLGARVARWVV